jgi:hypothetical protein
VVGGIAEAIVQRLVTLGASDGHTRFTMSTGHVMDRVQYDPELLKPVLDSLVAEAGVTPLFHAALAGVTRTGGAITQVELLTKAGMARVAPRIVIDASGDLDLLARAGAAFLALEPGEAMQPATAMFRFGPVDFAAFKAIPAAGLKALAAQGVAEGALARAALHASRVEGRDDAWFNIGRIALDATDPLALSAAEIEGRRQSLAAVGFLQRAVPGCAGGRLIAFAPQLGIRESRRMRGLHVLTEADLRAATPFEDRIAWGAYPIDVHPAQGAGLTFEGFGADHAYAIPLRCLIPVGLDNLLVAGRGISATHRAHAATRVMPTVMAIGEAAGTAAAMAVRGNAAPAQCDIGALQAALRAGGAHLP